MLPTQEIEQLTAVELLQLFAAKRLSPVDVTKNCLARIDQLNPHVNAYCHVDSAGALEQAKASEARWHRGEPLSKIDGVPCSIKDLILTRGMPTRRGSRTTSGNDSQNCDAPVSSRLRSAGAVILGKTTTCEFGWKGVTDSPLTGITRNPWDLSRTPGGSSGGTAVAAALNLGVLHVGSDAGGSVRIPAGFTGTFGFKPSFGLIPQWPSSAMGSLSHLGPITRTVMDSVLMTEEMSGLDQRDFYSVDLRQRHFSEDLKLGVKGLRIAYSPNLGYAKVEREIQSKVEITAQRLADEGAVVELVESCFPDPTAHFRTLWYAGAANAMAKLDDDSRALVDKGLLEIAESGREVDIIEYLRSIDERIQLAEQMRKFHLDWDLLLTPTLPISAFPVGSNVPPNWHSDDWLSWSPFCHPFNMTQQPAASVPVGETSNNLPIGVQIVGPKFRDDLVLRAAQVITASVDSRSVSDQFVLERGTKGL